MRELYLNIFLFFIIFFLLFLWGRGTGNLPLYFQFLPSDSVSAVHKMKQMKGQETFKKILSIIIY